MSRFDHRPFDDDLDDEFDDDPDHDEDCDDECDDDEWCGDRPPLPVLFAAWEFHHHG